MQAKHTPGPWIVAMKPEIDGERMPNGSGGMSYTGRDVYDRELGVVTEADWKDQSEYEPESLARPYNEADAHLIAAAPELLAELRCAVDRCAKCRSYPPEAPCEDCERIGKLLARATGQSAPVQHG